MARLLFFTSPIGLGHASRDIAIADALVDAGISKDEITFITSSPASSHIMEHGYHVLEAYRRKSIDARDGTFRHKLLWLLDYVSFYRECKGIASSILHEHKPDLVISDEDFASISTAGALSIKSVLITDVFESRFLDGLPSLLEGILNRSLKGIITRADMVIVPMYAHEHGYGYPSSNMVYVGPIVRRVEKGRDELRRALGFNGYKVILVSVGGTASGRFLIKRAIDAYTRIVDCIGMPTKLVIVSGPSIDPTHLHSHSHIPDSVATAAGRIEYHGYIKNMHEMIYAADLLISLAGRSTMDEARVYGTPSIFIPIKGHFEQEDNAKVYGFSHSDIYRLEDLILKHITDKRMGAITSYGAYEAAKRVYQLT
ncbi:MAG: glycosyltransferase [Candidatus Nitrosocaldus sp.]